MKKSTFFNHQVKVGRSNFETWLKTRLKLGWRLSSVILKIQKLKRLLSYFDLYDIMILMRDERLFPAILMVNLLKDHIQWP